MLTLLLTVLNRIVVPPMIVPIKGTSQRSVHSWVTSAMSGHLLHTKDKRGAPRPSQTLQQTKIAASSDGFKPPPRFGEKSIAGRLVHTCMSDARGVATRIGLGSKSNKKRNLVVSEIGVPSWGPYCRGILLFGGLCLGSPIVVNPHMFNPTPV